MIIPIDANKALGKKSTPIHNKNSQKNKDIERLPQIDTEIYKKHTANITHSYERMKHSHQRSGTR